MLSQKYALFEIKKKKNMEVGTLYLYCSDIESTTNNGMFENCNSIKNVSVGDGRKIKDISKMFYNCNNLVYVYFEYLEDYKKYLKQCVNKGKNENIQNDSNKEDISSLLDKDKSFMDGLNEYIRQNSDFLNKFKDTKQKLELLSEKIKSCSPYKGETYRGTKVYNKE